MRFAALLVALIAAAPAHAHALGATAKRVGDRVEVEAYFSDDTPARDAAVMVREDNMPREVLRVVRGEALEQ